MNTEIISLAYPIDTNGLESRELEMRRPTVADMMRMDKSKASDAEKELRLLADLCQCSPEELEKLDVSDYSKLQEKLRGFFS
ncbi:phage tail assembly protein [Endozoicomonas acroporae]|uniref:phage tail assembly protein n=1 Tax=Endozoicomonas acroporae TaxID=1701104 RepID=UPI003D78E2AB